MLKKVLAKTVGLPFNLATDPKLAKVLLHNIRGTGNAAQSDKIHLDATMKWLCRAQDVSGDAGVSAGYTFATRWTPPYPETTGYIIPTFLEYAVFTNQEYHFDRAYRMGGWEIGIQHPSGAVRGRTTNDPVPFDTGQVIFGWVALYRKTGEQRFLAAAKRAGDWLLAMQDEDGKWSRYEFKNVPHVYNSRVAWALLELGAVSTERHYTEAAERNIAWVLKQARDNGWFDFMAFTSGAMPFTHTIAYTLEGLLESSLHLNGTVAQESLRVVKQISNHLIERYQLRVAPSTQAVSILLPGTLGPSWESGDRYICLTGNAQFAIICLRLYELEGGAHYLTAARTLLDIVKNTQYLEHGDPGIRGAVAGSFPIWGGYLPFWYPNWAAKFFADALMHYRRAVSAQPRSHAG